MDQLTYAKFMLLASAVAFEVMFVVLISLVLYHRDSFKKRLMFGLPAIALAASIGFFQMDMYRAMVGVRQPLNDDFFLSVIVAELLLGIFVIFGRTLWLRQQGWWHGR